MSAPRGHLVRRRARGQKAYSPNFHRGESQLTSLVKIETSASALNARWDTFTRSGIEHCLEQFFQGILEAKLPSTYTLGTLTVTRFAVGIGPRSIGFRIAVPFTLNKLDPVVYLDAVLFVRGRAALELQAENIAEPFDRATEIRLARLMYDRVGDRAG